MSVYFNGGYAYNSKYLMDVTWRMNGSSVFGSNHRYMNTWSFGLAWNLHNESFIADHTDLFQMLKIRASIGNPKFCILSKHHDVQFQQPPAELFRAGHQPVRFG